MREAFSWGLTFQFIMGLLRGVVNISEALKGRLEILD